MQRQTSKDAYHSSAKARGYQEVAVLQLFAIKAQQELIVEAAVMPGLTDDEIEETVEQIILARWPDAITPGNIQGRRTEMTVCAGNRKDCEEVHGKGETHDVTLFDTRRPLVEKSGYYRQTRRKKRANVWILTSYAADRLRTRLLGPPIPPPWNDEPYGLRIDVDYEAFDDSAWG